MNGKNLSRRVISFILVVVMAIGILPLSAVNASVVLDKGFEGEWRNDDGSTITISNLQADVFDFEAMLLYYPNDTARQYDNPNIGSLGGKATAVNNNTAQMLYTGEWSGQNRKITVTFEFFAGKLIIKTDIPAGSGGEYEYFGFGYNVKISGEYYKKDNSSVPTDTVEYNGHYYKAYDMKMTWHEAKAYCENLGGHLVTITSQEEQKFLNDIIILGNKNRYFTGGYRVDSSSKWEWVTEETFSYTNWKIREPNSSIEHYIEIFAKQYPSNDNPPIAIGVWNNVMEDGNVDGSLEFNPRSLVEFFGSDNVGFICEWGIDEVDDPNKPHNFLYNGNLGAGNFEAEYVYSDQYFNGSSYDFKWDLAKMSLDVSMAAFGRAKVNYYNKNDIEDCKDYNIKKLLEDIGFDNIDTSLGYPDEPQTHSIGVAFGIKPIIDNSECMLIVIAIRGGGYEREWGGNFELGLGEIHEGISRAKERVLEEFYRYINQYGVATKIVNKKIKLWITGYSRGSAVANLLGATFDDEINNTGKLNGLFPMKKEDIYTYCFATPAATKNKNTTNDIYKNIFCIVNPNDFVPKFAPEAWKYRRYGETYFIPTPEDFAGDYTNLENMMLEEFIKLNKTEKEKFMKKDYLIDDFEFINGADPFSLIRYYQYNKRQSLFLDKFIHIFAKEAVKSQFNYNLYYQSSMVNLLTDFGAEKGIVMLKDLFGSISLLIQNLTLTAPDYVATVVANSSGIFQGHFPEVYFAWLQSSGTKFTSGKYRIVQVNCPVDVEVYDSKNNLVASIIDNEPQEIMGSSIISAIDENEQKIIYLPSMENYTIKILATDNGKMTYSVNDFDRNVGSVTRVVNYYDVEIEKNDVLTAHLENLDIEPNARYELFDNNNEKIELSEDINNEDLLYYEVNVSIEGKGYIIGEGTKTKGEYIKLQAIELEDYKFDGWYSETQKISSESEYRFCVLSNVNLIAKFIYDNDITVDSYIYKIGSPYFIINGVQKEIDPGRNTSPVIVNDRTLIPIRSLIEELGGTVNWNAGTRTVDILYNEIHIGLTIDKTDVIITDLHTMEEISYKLDVPAQISNDRTMVLVPCRFVIEQFGGKVSWDEKSQEVTIKFKRPK